MRAGLGMGLGTLIHLVPQIILLIGCIIYISKVKAAESVLLIIGETLIIISVIGSFVMQFFMYKGNMSIQGMSQLMLIPSGLSFIGAVLFAVGFIMMANKQKTHEQY